MFGSFIEDGYTEKGFVRGIPGLHGDVRFTYRPVLTHDRAKFMRLIKSMQPEEQELKGAKLLAGQVATWNLTNSKGEAVPVDEQSARRIKPAVADRMFAIVMGTQPSDIDPEWTADETAKQASEQIDAMLSGTSIGEAREEADAKN